MASLVAAGDPSVERISLVSVGSAKGINLSGPDWGQHRMKVMKMRRISAIVSIILISATALAMAGDVKIRYIRYYNDPNFKGDLKKFSDEVVRNIEVDLSGTAGVKELQASGCNLLSYLYSTLQNSDYMRVVKRIAAMNEYHLYIYLIDDRKGLTPIMQSYAGVCDYVERDGKRYAWLCGHYTPECAIKIGEHYAQRFFEEFEKVKGAKEAFSALAATFLGEMMHTVYHSPHYWYPNNLVLKPSSVDTRLSFTGLKMPASKFKKRRAGPTSDVGPWLTLMPNITSSNIRALEIFLSACWSRSLLDVYEKFFWCDGLFYVENGSATHKELQAHSLGDFGGANDKFIGYFFTSLYANRNKMDKFFVLKDLTDNEVFIALTLFYFCAYWPHENDSAGNTSYGFELALDAYNAVKAEKPSEEPGLLMRIVGTMFKRMPSTTSPPEVRKRRLFFIALLDLLSDYAGDRSSLNYHLEKYVIPTKELQPLLREYFGTGGQPGIRDKLRKATETKDTIQTAVNVLAGEFNRLYYLPTRR